jgi:proteasome assembly chaperone (PAC2) family protein
MLGSGDTLVCYEASAEHMTESYEVHEHPELHEPVLVVMLQGWIDAGNAAANAMTVLDSQLSARLIASFHPDKFIDHRARRPVLQIRDGVNVGLQWPEIVLKAGKDAEGRDALLLMGAEPDMNWHAFCDATVELAAQFEVSMMVGLGAYPIAVPHSRPSRLSVSASNETLAQRASYFRNSVDVPAGISAALEEALAASGIPTIGLWAQIPHYISASPYPGGSVALLGGLADVANLATDCTSVEEEAATLRQWLDEKVTTNTEHVAMVRQLEEAWDAEIAPTPSLIDNGPLPSGDELAAELERFLREQG